MGTRRTMPALLCSVLLGAAFLFVNPARLPAAEPPPAESGQALDAVPATVRVNGILEPAACLDLHNQVRGETCIRFIVPEGKAVEKDTLLVKLDDTALVEKYEHQRVVVEKTQATIVAAQSGLEAIRAETEAALSLAEQAVACTEGALKAFLADGGELGLELAELESEIALATRRQKIAAGRLERLKKLPALHVAQEDLEEAELVLAETEAQLEAAAARKRFLTGPHRDQRVAELKLAIARERLEVLQAKHKLSGAVRTGEAGIAAAQAESQMARRVLERLQEELLACAVRSPQAGVILYPDAVEGQGAPAPGPAAGSVVRHGQVLLRLADTTRLRMTLHLPLKQAQRVAPGSAVKVRCDAFPDRELEAKVVTVGVLRESVAPSTLLDRKTPMASATVVIKDPPPGVRFGMTAVAELRLQEQ